MSWGHNGSFMFLLVHSSKAFPALFIRRTCILSDGIHSDCIRSDGCFVCLTEHFDFIKENCISSSSCDRRLFGSNRRLIDLVLVRLINDVRRIDKFVCAIRRLFVFFSRMDLYDSIVPVDNCLIQVAPFQVVGESQFWSPYERDYGFVEYFTRFRVESIPFYEGFQDNVGCLAYGIQRIGFVNHYRVAFSTLTQFAFHTDSSAIQLLWRSFNRHVDQ